MTADRREKLMLSSHQVPGPLTLSPIIGVRVLCTAANKDQSLYIACGIGPAVPYPFQ
jgi:hypothetical protein